MQLARNIAVEWGPKNIRANAIAPGLVRTDFARALWEDPALYRKRTRDTPLQRIGEPDEIAGAAVYLASAAGSFTTGQTIVIDGGTTAGSVVSQRRLTVARRCRAVDHWKRMQSETFVRSGRFPAADRRCSCLRGRRNGCVAVARRGGAALPRGQKPWISWPGRAGTGDRKRPRRHRPAMERRGRATSASSATSPRASRSWLKAWSGARATRSPSMRTNTRPSSALSRCADTRLCGCARRVGAQPTALPRASMAARA